MVNENGRFTPDEVFSLATHPWQYEIVPTGWDGHGETAEAAARIDHYLSYLNKFTENWRGRDVLDIGAGTGWLVDHAIRKGVKSAIGIEPAGANVAIGRVTHPNATILQQTFEQYEPQQALNTVVSVMAIGHIADLNGAFKKIKGLLEPSPDSEILLVVPEYNYFTKIRNGYKEVVVYDLSPDVALEMSVKENGSKLADIVRKPKVFYETAKQIGFSVSHDIPMPATDAYIQAVPRYKANRETPMTRLLRFTPKTKK